MFFNIHGHFYQPPRENPWTGEIPLQESALPFHDWNERITNECYEPNGRSRVLNDRGQITAIVNNFAHISWDFGPTLLSDLERRFPMVYRRVQEADRLSAANHGGHGNGIAQAYNHMILPLATLRDKWTQVRWGLRDFEYRFGRKSEGLWLAETAIDDETLRVVAEAGVRFLILAPHQALRVRPLGGGDWTDIRDDHPVNTARAYRCFAGPKKQRRKRWVDVFFYDGPLSVAVSFEHLLRGAGQFADRLEEASRQAGHDGLVHLATDGEIYGHHEPFADMCLAYVFQQEAVRRRMRFVNYGEYLDLYPPVDEAELNFADTGEGTAWSCAHGVGRWIRDCGCNTGAPEGWNQAWRTPLREGLDALRDRVLGAFQEHLSPHLKDVWAARDDYIEVILDPSEESRDAFLGRHTREELDEQSRRTVWTLLSAAHQAMLMYTSCAWFFNDISGLEVQQNLGYASRACELAQPYVAEDLEKMLLEHLARAESNVPEWGNGARVYKGLVLPRRFGPEHAAGQAAFEAAVLERGLDSGIHRYVLEGSADPGCGRDEGGCRGRIRVTDPLLEQAWSWVFEVTPGRPGQRQVTLEPAVDAKASVPERSASFTLGDFRREVREETARHLLGHLLEQDADRFQEIFDEARDHMAQLRELGLTPPQVHSSLGRHVLNRRLRQLSEGVGYELARPPDSWWDQLGRILKESRELDLDADPSPVALRMEKRLHLLLDRALHEEKGETASRNIEAAFDTLSRADNVELPVNRTGLEMRTYELALQYRDELINLEPEAIQVAAEAGVSGIMALYNMARHANLDLSAVLREGPALGARRPLAADAGRSMKNAQG